MFGLTDPPRRRLVLAIALFAIVGAARFADPDPNDGVGILLIAPVALIAGDFGWRKGVAAAGAGTLLIAIWGVATKAPITAIGHGARLVAFATVALAVARAIEQHRRRGEQAERWFSMANDLLATIDLEGRFETVNHSWSTLLGYSRADLAGRSFRDFVHPQDLDQTVECGRHLATHVGESVDFENRYRASDGSWHWLRWSARSDQHGVYAAGRDVTAQKLLDAEREQLLDRVTRMALTDELTGLANRGAWRARLTAAMTGEEQPLTVAIIDIDLFKELNDAEGHLAGDRLLRDCAAAWRDAIRERDVLGRLGGDEFGLFMPGCDLPRAREVIARLHDRTPGGMTCSVGIAAWDGEESEDALFNRADTALYAAKDAGRDRVHEAAPDTAGTPEGPHSWRPPHAPDAPALRVAAGAKDAGCDHPDPGEERRQPGKERDERDSPQVRQLHA